MKHSPTLRLEYEPQAHLEPAGVVALRRSADLSETGVFRGLSRGHRQAWIREVRMIGCVEGLRAELDILAFADPGILDQRDVEIVLTRSAEGREPERPGTKLGAQQ